MGTHVVDITPPIGTPSAGYAERKGAGMEGVHDPLLASALVVDTGKKKVLFCSVDHLGVPYTLVQKVKAVLAEKAPELSACPLFIGSSHTHSGGGAYLDIPVLGQALAGVYDPKIVAEYVDKIALAIIKASQKMEPALCGIGYGTAKGISRYRSSYPPDVALPDGVTLVKVTKLDGTPLALLFTYALHPTVLGCQSRLFSADFVGSTRAHIAALLGSQVVPLYFNGAQAEIVPELQDARDGFAVCDMIGAKLADSVKQIWDATQVAATLEIDVEKKEYSFVPQQTPFGMGIAVSSYDTELNFIVINKDTLFVTIPGELSVVYDLLLQKQGKAYGFKHIAVLGLTNDAHGYILTPESYLAKTKESALSFGGEAYGEEVLAKILDFMQARAACVKRK